MKEVNTIKCGRENDLIGFLYGELNEGEALAFQKHLGDCATCNTELTGFGAVRQSVVAWRNESLAGVAFPTQATESLPLRAAEAPPSALAALREFFNLSPLWMKGAVAFASILFCVFAGLAVARLRDKPPSAGVVGPTAPTQSTQEFNALIERRVQEELKRIKDSEQRANSPLTANNSGKPNSTERIGHRRNVEVATAIHSARRPLSKTEREQLAADLRLVSSKSDSDLSLLDDRINQ
jgi:anti-sigma factor RsiW